ncbi:hypothetical protein ACFSYH_02005 [Populibacterium corticicola]|uniref:Uncharacterized protein n=1 Tax=Populibacterium corticicola TaxID=1812826 RepID=A0ABW5XA73_9MICO
MNAFDIVVGISGCAGAWMVAYGSWGQWRIVARDFRETQDADTYWMIDELLTEHPEWRFFKRRRQRKLVAQMLDESPAELAAYQRADRLLTAWTSLVAGSFLVAVMSVGAFAASLFR